MLKLFYTYYPIRKLLFLLIEGIIVYLGLWFVGHVYYEYFNLDDASQINVWLRVLFVTLILQLSLYYNNLYDFNEKQNVIDLLLKTIKALGFSCLIVAAAYYFFPQIILDQYVLFTGIFLLIIFLVLWRYFYQILCIRKLFNEKYFLIGDGHLAQMIANETSSLDSGYTIAGIFSNPSSSGLSESLGVQHYNGYNNLYELSQSKGVKTLVMALQEMRGHAPIKELLECRLYGIRVMDGVSFYENLSGKVLATQAPPSWIIYSDGFRRHRFIILGKRGLDITCAVLGLVLSLPLMTISAGLIKFSSPGPVFFRQTRIGQIGREYNLVKFRTMRQDAEKRSGAVWAQEHDPRITRIGAFLRKFRIDEIPQFWNVLKGEMSFVGPRPERPEFVEQLTQKIPYYSERHTLKPGITGWAQVNYPYGATEEDALRKLEYDLFYIKNLSLLFDLFIVLKTIKTVIAGEGAR